MIPCSTRVNFVESILEKENIDFETEMKVTDFFDIAFNWFVWGHNTAGTWYLNKILERRPELKKEFKRCIDLENLEDSWINIAQLKPAEGIKLAEVAGSAYAWMTAFLGGEGTYCVRNGEGGPNVGAGIVSPISIKDKKDFDTSRRFYKTLGPATLGPNKYQRIDASYHTTITEEREFCHEGNYRNFFKDKNYDLFMAVNHGNPGSDEYLAKIAEKVLKREGNEIKIIKGEDGRNTIYYPKDSYIDYQSS